jgi:DNA polymerase-3 subunit delta'
MSVWDDVVGQDRAVRVPASGGLPEGALAQSWLITGPPGSGRSTAARALRGDLAVRDRVGCGQCTACRTVLAGTHPDVTAVATDKLSISKQEVRDLVLTAQRSPATGRHRVVIVEDADRMSAGTFNVLLKSIEEPPPSTVWMLCAPSAEDLAATIRSRCRLVTLRVPPSDVVAELLVRRDGVEPELAARAARAAQGHIGLALRYATQEGALAARESTARDVLTLHGAGQAVLAATRLVDRRRTRRRNMPIRSPRRSGRTSCARPGWTTEGAAGAAVTAASARGGRQAPPDPAGARRGRPLPAGRVLGVPGRADPAARHGQ